MSDQDEPEDRRTEGVRIIGAQEAAEAAGRPDVVRRRRRSEKKYGDRPDEPAPASDLPKITISTTESDAGSDRFGAVPVVRPGSQPPGAPAPKWAEQNDLPPAYGEDSERAGFGHARIVDEEAPGAAWTESAGGSDPLGAPGVADDRDPFGATDVETSYEPDPSPAPAPSHSTERAPQRTVSFEPEEVPVVDQYDDSPEGDDDRWATREPFADPPGERTRERRPASEFSDDYAEDYSGDLAEPDADDSFVLPHWTEPPTGQVPKVVIGDDAPEPEPLATYGSQPRWRDEGERSQVTDFDDLIDDEPLLGALRSDGPADDDFFSDGPFEDERFVDESSPSQSVAAVGVDDLVDDYDEDFDEFAPEDDYDDAPPPARRPRPRRSDDDGGTSGGSGGGDRNLGMAVGVGVGLVAVGLLCFWLGALPTALLATVVVSIAGFEYFTAVRESGHNPATLLGIVAVAGLMVATFASGMAAYPIVIGLTVIFGLLWFLWVAPGERSATNLGLTLLGVLWIGFLGSFSTLFLGLGKVLEDSSDAVTSNPGIGVLIAAVIAAVSHDVGAYFIGRYFGKTPLSAASPNKTQEGLVGGVVSSLVVTLVVVGLVGIAPIGGDIARVFVFALLCALVAPLGDLCESFIKRDLGIKDMGTVLPGHGGVLDRFDALLFVLPTAYFVTVLFDIWGSVGS